ncbi:SoxR reducing system RseC family protein [Candidatus Methylospira mobilis]|uniref:SoxR reducing system RseC family protein n=1 Tax=Candidatus Methylospira mobilis TaxID=1808979 RepID=A0A5Q0BL28_9GAMM|nr:SoxR reducing system RseC family protein [Candidatus Methylospira mobilis]QFY42901.1 SoxR reducing system RseC family protein [Candidatus Methylospira mobilis]WNV03863.1 SoxR reducing system RseC family protein [Candidatus Methylospira mobilis]
MIEEEVCVTSVKDDVAWVEKTSVSPCGSCREACAGSIAGKLFARRKLSFSVHADPQLNIGDRIVVGLPDSALVRASFLVYLLPLMGFFIGAFLVGELAARLNLPAHDLLSLSGGLLGIVFCLILIRFSGFFEGAMYRPVILRKLS